VLDPHRAPVADAELLLHELRELRGVELAHGLHVLGDAPTAGPVALAHHVVDERLPRGGVVEVAVAAHQQCLLEGAFQRAVGSLDVAILLLRADLRRARLHPEVSHDREVVVVEGPLAALADDALAVGEPRRITAKCCGYFSQAISKKVASSSTLSELGCSNVYVRCPLVEMSPTSAHGSTGKSWSAFIFLVMTRKTAIHSLTVVGEYVPALTRGSHESHRPARTFSGQLAVRGLLRSAYRELLDLAALAKVDVLGELPQ
jgi:hypothetical protein